MISDLIKKALNAKRESKSIDFKESFNVNSSNEWCELIKDIIAMSNSGGGAILIGVDNNGNPIGFDINPLLEYDSADITDKIYRYTGIQFSDFDILAEEKDGQKVAVFLINGVSIPVVFIRSGNYEGGGRPKTAFAVGTVYFRHGAKSEPGNTDDIGKAIERQLESIRKDWVQGVRKIVTAPPGSNIIVAATDMAKEYSPKTTSIRAVKDLSVPAIRLTRNKEEASGTLLHEELGDGLFDEINNVLDANALLAKSNDRFLLGSPIYHRIYAERQYVVDNSNQMRLLASTGCSELYGPTLYWLLKLPLNESSHIIRQMCENPKFHMFILH